MSIEDDPPLSPEEARTLFVALIAALGEIHGVVKGFNDVAVALDRIADQLKRFNDQRTPSKY